MPTFLNGIQVVIEFNWNLKVDSRLHNKRFVSQARQTPHSREARDKREARCVRREEKNPNIFGSTFAKILNLNFRHIWRYLYPSFDLRFRRTLLTSPLAREEGGGGGGGGGGREIRCLRNSEVQSAYKYDFTSRVSDFRNGEQSVHRRDRYKFRIYHGNTVSISWIWRF